jgi:hypothetical protein
MGERKVLNKYFPADFDPSLVPRGNKLSKKDGTVPVRMMLPFSVQCSTCNTFLYRGRKFNSKKEPMGGPEGRYLGIQRFRFYIKCTHCSRTISFLTDPEKTDYEMESGGTRNYEVYKDKEKSREQQALEKEKGEKEDPMKALENRVLDSQREMADLDNLEEIRAMNRKHFKLMSSNGGGFDAKAVLKALDDRIQEETITNEEELNEHGITEDEEKLVQSIKFGGKQQQQQQKKNHTTGGELYGGGEGKRKLVTIVRLGADDERKEEERRKMELEMLQQKQKENDNRRNKSKAAVRPLIKIKAKRKKIADAGTSKKKKKSVVNPSSTPTPTQSTKAPPATETGSKATGLASLLGDYGSSSDSD